MPNQKQRRWPVYLFCVLVFLFMMVFLTWIHGLVIYDMDEWLYIYYRRKAMPLWGNFNPCKVFPEVFMPLCGMISAYFVRPLTGGDFIQALTFVFALALSLFVLFYLISALRFLHKRFELSGIQLVLVGSVFFLFHFMILRGSDQNNQHLFYSSNVNNVFNYLMPALLNASLVLFLQSRDKAIHLWSQEYLPQKAVLVLALYLSVFSNLYSNIILAVWAGVSLLFALIAQFRSQAFAPKSYLKQNSLYLCILGLWCVSPLFELSGGRASQADNNIGAQIQQTVKNLCHGLGQMNHMFLLLAVLILGCAAVLWFLNRSKDELDRFFLPFMVKCAICGALLLPALVLLSAKVNVDYIERADVLIGCFFYLLLMLASSLAYLLRRVPQALLALPIILLVIFSETNTDCRTFREYNLDNLSPTVCKAVDDDIIAQMQAADEAGESSIALSIPAFPGNDNYPMCVWANKRYSEAFYKLGLTSRMMNVELVPNEEMTEKYRLR